MDPLVFEPYFRPQPWGGRRLATVLGKPLPAEGRFGESWELSTHPHHESRVAEGPLAGASLADLCRDRAAEIFGDARPAVPGQFPLLVKFLDCDELLSVQVHPNDAQARELLGEPCGKSEAWVVLAAEPTARIYAGFRPGVTRPQVERAAADGTIGSLLHSFTPRVGDCVYLPAGTVHAVGGGVLLAEVQQTSDATFRLYDWGRQGLDGRPRELHVEQALRCIDWAAGPVGLAVQALSRAEVELLVRTEHFQIKRRTLREPYELRPAQASIWIVVEGECSLGSEGGNSRQVLRRGHVALVPASAGRTLSIHPSPVGSAVLLEVRPTPEDSA
jgi:mannose-6-phosphate isomerase